MRSRNLNVFGTRFLWPVLRFGRRTSCNKLTDVASLVTFSFCNDITWCLYLQIIYKIIPSTFYQQWDWLHFPFLKEYVPKRHILLWSRQNLVTVAQYFCLSSLFSAQHFLLTQSNVARAMRISKVRSAKWILFGQYIRITLMMDSTQKVSRH